MSLFPHMFSTCPGLFLFNAQEVTALAVHPHKDVVASGQAGKEAIVCLFDASRKVEADRRGSDAGSVAEAGAGAGAANPSPAFLRELSLGKKEKRGVRCGTYTSTHTCRVNPVLTFEAIFA